MMTAFFIPIICVSWKIELLFAGHIHIDPNHHNYIAFQIKNIWLNVV